MSEKSPSKCSDCKRVFGSGYQDNLIDKTVQQCDEFEWCWDCDNKHTEQEIRNQTLAQVEKIIDKESSLCDRCLKYYENNCSFPSCITHKILKKEIKNLKDNSQDSCTSVTGKETKRNQHPDTHSKDKVGAE